MRTPHRLLSLGIVIGALVLAGCTSTPAKPDSATPTASGSTTATACAGSAQDYRLSFEGADPKRIDALSAAAKRVVGRRLASLGEAKAQITLESSQLSVCVSQKDAVDQLTDQLQNSPFSFALMEQVAGSGGDIVTEQFGSFVGIGVTEQEIEWVEPHASAETGKGKVVIRFTAQGQRELQKAYARLGGKMVGMFVRGVPMSLMTVKPGEKPNSLTIDGITSAELAEIFADDVNVGTFVRFGLVRP